MTSLQQIRSFSLLLVVRSLLAPSSVAVGGPGRPPTAIDRSEQLTQHVDPMIGTGGEGHTFPGAVLPFGGVQVSPSNGVSGWRYCSGYHYESEEFVGLGHQFVSGAGIADLGIQSQLHKGTGLYVIFYTGGREVATWRERRGDRGSTGNKMRTLHRILCH